MQKTTDLRAYQSDKSRDPGFRWSSKRNKDEGLHPAASEIAVAVAAEAAEAGAAAAAVAIAAAAEVAAAAARTIEVQHRDDCYSDTRNPSDRI